MYSIIISNTYEVLECGYFASFYTLSAPDCRVLQDNTKIWFDSTRTQHGTKEYLKYVDSHPEEFRDEPVLAGCGTVSLKSIESEESTADDIDLSVEYRRKRWEDYHLAKAKALGFIIDTDLLAQYFPRRGSNFDVL